jgi:hypothetical protein
MSAVGPERRALSGLAPPASTVLRIRAARGRACGAPLTLETSASPAGLTAWARPKARPRTRAATSAGRHGIYEGRGQSEGSAQMSGSWALTRPELKVTIHAYPRPVLPGRDQENCATEGGGHDSGDGAGPGWDIARRPG